MRIRACLAIVATLISGCSTRPREFRAQLASTPPAPAVFEQDMLRCQILARRGFKADFKNVAAQVAVGGGTGVVAGGVAASAALTSGGLETLYSSAAIGAAAMTVVGIGAGFGMSRIIRANRESKYKASLGACLTEYGYSLSGLKAEKKRRKSEYTRPLTIPPPAPAETAATEGQIAPPAYIVSKAAAAVPGCSAIAPSANCPATADPDTQPR